MAEGNAKFSAVTLDVQVDEQAVKDAIRDLEGIRGAVPRAISAALNKTASKAKTLVVKLLTKRLTVKASNIRKTRIDVTPSTPKTLVALVKILGRRIGLINFAHKQTAKGVEAQAFKGGPWELFPHAFIAVGLSNNEHVFRRYGEKRRYGKRVHYQPNKGKLKQPIEGLKGLSLYRVFKESPAMQKEVVELISDDLGPQIRSQVDRILDRRKADRPR